MKTFTVTQKQRLRELGTKESELERVFDTQKERDETFNGLVRNLVEQNKQRLRQLHSTARRPTLRIIESKLVKAATSIGFIEVVTPMIVSREFIRRMEITEKDPLWNQIFWLSEKKCLRPMLAPNLYFVMGKLSRFWRPVRIFEIGPCFRRDTKGSQHLEEFTMFNMVELAPQEDVSIRLEKMIYHIMKYIGLPEYKLKRESSEVYGSTIDVIVNGVEVASAAVGPIPKDEKWDITDDWAGVGFGVERLAMVTEGFNSLARVGRSLIYLNGSRLDIETRIVK